MEEGGFTLVQEEPDNVSRKRGRDKYDQVFKGVSEEEANRLFAAKRSKEGIAYMPNSEKKDQIRQDFYMF